ncbi:LysR family transcriptional regulator [Aminobacter sp. MSH1]|uniref:LysR family transcriptional regulator n=1 Tax=Aminobacter sp. MSH1 TaxID=374606 RepID=UPI000D3B4059|nr:LysR family transcriptional regulator [Aminobacter sp. MSH1]
MSIDPRQLRYVLAIANAGSMVEAAKRLNLSQPALSISLSRLEHQLKTRLFERNRRGMRLTPDGELLARYAEGLEAILDRASSELRLSRSGISGPVRIGGTPLTMRTIIPAALKYFFAEYPNINIEIIEDTEQNLQEKLITSSIDVALCTTDASTIDNQIEDTYLFSSRVVVVVNATHRLALLSKLKIGDLSGSLFVLPTSGGSFRKQLDAMFLIAGEEMPSRVIQSNSFSALREILLQTNALTLLPIQIIRKDVTDGILCAIPLIEGTGRRTISLRIARSRRMPEAVARMRDLVLQLAPLFEDTGDMSIL